MSSPDQPAGSPAAQRRTVLVVEDEELLRADRPPLEVICAYDGLEVEL